MAQTSRPWQSTSPGDAGPYSAQQWQTLYESIIGYAAQRANVGVLLGTGAQPTDPLRVQAQAVATSSVDVLAGSALVQGIAYINTAIVPFTIAANSSGNPRIDTVVLRADYALQTVRLAVLQGTPGASPVAPTLTQSANVLWEIPIADIAVANGFVTITNANITQRSEPANAANGVYLDNIKNNSGVTLNTGDVVIWDTTADRSVTTTTTVNNPLLAGVWVGRTANGGYGRVLRIGVGYVNTVAAVNRGDNLVSSSTVKLASVSTSLIGARLGMALETTTGAGPALTFVNVQFNKGWYPVVVEDLKTSGTAPASITAGAWRTRVLNTLTSDVSGLAALASNQITLQPGTYLVWFNASGTMGATGGVADRLRLRNISDGTTLLQGNNSGSRAASTSAPVLGFGVFTITVAKVIELQHISNTTGNAGVILSSGDQESYATVTFLRID